MNDSLDISVFKEKPPAHLIEKAPHLTDRAIVHLVNGVDVARMKVLATKQAAEGSWFKRAFGALSGTTARRDAQTKELLVESQKTLIEWQVELTLEVAKSDVALARLARSVSSLGDSLSKLGHHVASLEKKVSEVQEHVRALDDRVGRLELDNRARLELERVCDMLGTGNLRHLPRLAQVHLAVDQLYWGEFGHFLRRYPEESAKREEHLRLSLVRACRDAWDITAGGLEEVRSSDDFLVDGVRPSAPKEEHDHRALVGFLALSAQPEAEPFTFTLCQRYALEDPIPLVRRFPGLLTVEQSVVRMTQEARALAERASQPSLAAPSGARSRLATRITPPTHPSNRRSLGGRASETRKAASQRKKVGLVLSGGGMLGAYHAGVVRALSEHGIEVDAVAGASVGALNGAVVSASNDVHEAADRLERLWLEVANRSPIAPHLKNWLKLVGSLAMATGRLHPAAAALITLYDFVTPKDLDEGYFTKEPLRELIATCLESSALERGKPLYVSVFPAESSTDANLEGIRRALNFSAKPSEFLHVQSLPSESRIEALLASASLPIIYGQHQVGERKYMDGGVGGGWTSQGNTPITPLIEAGCETILVVHLATSTLWNRHDFEGVTIVEIAIQEEISKGVVTDLLSIDHEKAERLITRGYDDTLRALESVRHALAARDELHLARTSMDEAVDDAVQNTARVAREIDAFGADTESTEG